MMKKSYTLSAALLMTFILCRSLPSVIGGTVPQLIGGVLAVLLPVWLASLSPFSDLPRAKSRLFPETPVVWAVFPMFLAVVLATDALFSFLGQAIGIAPAAVPALSLPETAALYVLLPAISEEMLFRFLLPSLLSPFGRRGSLLCCALLFAAAHAPLSMPHAFLAGILLGISADVCGSPLPGIVMHAANNGLWIILDRCPAARPGVFGVLIVSAVAGVLTLALTKRGKDALLRVRELWNDRQNLREQLSSLIFSPMVIPVLYFLLIAADSLLRYVI